jgi:hypothetical protein
VISDSEVESYPGINLKQFFTVLQIFLEVELKKYESNGDIDTMRN